MDAKFNQQKSNVSVIHWIQEMKNENLFFQSQSGFFGRNCTCVHTVNRDTAFSQNLVKRTTHWFADQVVPHWEQNFPNVELLCPCINNGPF
jgi:hypothetical protein